jgi:NAD(P)-dependent dehydrogenase (short-subunit alcohol dehydrogenase family)
MSRLSNKVAIMTGASKGIGGGIATFLASDESAWINGEVIRAAGGLVVAF